MIKMYISEKETIQRAEELATPLSALIYPEDVHEDSSTWEEVPDQKLEAEIYQSIDIILSELNHHTNLKDLIHRRALTYHKENMLRAPMHHLSFSTKISAVENGYWPFDMSKGELWEHLIELYPTCQELHIDDYEHAHTQVSIGLQTGMNPKE